MIVHIYTRTHQKLNNDLLAAGHVYGDLDPRFIPAGTLPPRGDPPSASDNQPEVAVSVNPTTPASRRESQKRWQRMFAEVPPQGEEKHTPGAEEVKMTTEELWTGVAEASPGPTLAIAVCRTASRLQTQATNAKGWLLPHEEHLARILQQRFGQVQHAWAGPLL